MGKTGRKSYSTPDHGTRRPLFPLRPTILRVLSGLFRVPMGAFVANAYGAHRLFPWKPPILAWWLRPYSELWGVAPVRRNGLARLFMVAVSRRGAPGGAVRQPRSLG